MRVIPESKKAEKTEISKDNGIKIPKSAIKIIGLIIIVLIAGFFIGRFTTGMVTTGPSGPSAAVPSNEIGQKVVDYVNKNLVQPGSTASLVSVEESNGLYKVTTLYKSQNIPIYATNDGSLIFISQPLLLNETIPNEQEQPTTIPKIEKPTAELFVMSFCPYGVQAENIMKPVVDVLGTKADIKVRFIASVTGNTTDSVQSLHGSGEAMEDLRQVCIMKYYPDKYWAYLMDMNKNCYPKWSDAAALDKCWKAAAANASIDASKIDSCSKIQEGLDLLKEDERIADSYGVSGSPTLIINGAQYSGSRTSDAFKSGICSGFTNPPAECSQVVNSTADSSAPTGGCGA